MNTGKMNKTRYMDVLTVRPSQGHADKTQVAHSNLLVEPVVLPDMTHLSVDDSLAVRIFVCMCVCARMYVCVCVCLSVYSSVLPDMTHLSVDDSLAVRIL